MRVKDIISYHITASAGRWSFFGQRVRACTV